MARCVYVLGVVLVGVALAAVPSVAVVSSYVGGSAVDGRASDGSHFVNPGHGRPSVPVDAATWRAVYWVERLWPWSALVPGLLGLLLLTRGAEASREPLPVVPARPWVLWVCLAGAGITLGGAGLCWAATRAPWATMLVGWFLACACCGAVARLHSRAARARPPAELGPAPPLHPGGGAER